MLTAFHNDPSLPQALTHLKDMIFEGLPNAVAQHWPERFIGAIQPGADVSMVMPRFLLWLLADELPQYVKEKAPIIKAALADVAALYREWIDTEVKPASDDAIAYATAAVAWAVANPGESADASVAYATADTFAAVTAAWAAPDLDLAEATAAYKALKNAYAAANGFIAYYSGNSTTTSWQQVCERRADKLIELLTTAPAAPGIS